MTEESSADEGEPEPAEGEEPTEGEATAERERESTDEEHEPAEENGFAPARSDEEPDVEAAKEELAAVGRANDEGEEDGDEDEENSNDETGAEDADTDVATAADVDGEPNPEDLVRDPDEPQVTSSLEEAEAAEAEAEAAEAEAEAAEAEAEAATEAEGEGTPEDAAAESETDAQPTAETETAAEKPAEESATDEQTHQPGVPEDVQKYDRFKKVDGSQYERVNEFLRDRTYITAREWAIARLCSDFRTETGIEMTKIGDNLPELVPFMTDTYTPQAVNQARASFEDKVRTAGATFLYGAMCDFFTAEELDDVMYEATEVAKFLLEVEGVELSVEDELDAEDRISAVMRDVRSSSAELRHERCPECGAELSGGD